MRTPEPDFVTEWRKQSATPKCCHTCEHYSIDGECEYHGMTPPDDFTALADACLDWAMEIPF